MEGTTSLKIFSKLNQKGGIDCPSCAWPDPDGKRSGFAEYCENGIKAIADEATFQKAGPELFAQYSLVQLSALSDFALGKLGRLSHPMIKRPEDTHYRPIDWTEALDLIAEALRRLPDPNQAVFYTSGRSSNEAAFLYQLMVRAFGTNNLPDCSNLCHESSGVALTETIGIGKGTVTLADFEKAELILILGQNPGTNHPRMLSSLEAAKQRGAKIVAINPLKEPGLIHFKNPQTVHGLLGGGTSLADEYVQLRVNTDLFLLKALLKALMDREKVNPGSVIARTFVQHKTSGFEELQRDIEMYSIPELLSSTGIGQEQFDRLVELIASSKRIIACWAMGLTQHKNAVATIQELVNLLLLKGSIGIPGAGLCPVRGHSNVQGDRTMGIQSKISETHAQQLQRQFNLQVPTASGYDVVGALQAMHQEKVKVYMALGGNLLSASPDTHFVAEAFNKTELTVFVSTKLNRNHLITGQTSLILPCLGRTDLDIQHGKTQFLSTENSMGVVQKTQGVMKPNSEELKSEPWIVAQLAHRILPPNKALPWLELGSNYESIRALIAATIAGFESYNTEVKKPGGFYIPNGPREGRFTTPSGKAMFTVNNAKFEPMGEEELLMMTIRSHDQFNTTIYGMNDRYRGVIGERRVLFMNIRDMEKRNLKQYQVVSLESRYHGQIRTAENFKIIAYDIPEGCCATYFPESNPVIPISEFADKSRTPISKSIRIRIVISS